MPRGVNAYPIGGGVRIAAMGMSAARLPIMAISNDKLKAFFVGRGLDGHVNMKGGMVF